MRNLSTMRPTKMPSSTKGGVFALVGPTGVGKTTSTAKLAARCVMRHGPEKLALITTDAYRIGGHEQLRIYGKILGVMVHSVKDEADLRIALKELKNKHTVLIDTVGVSQRDQMVAEQVAMLSGAGTDVKRLLCLNATATGETLNEVVRAYQGSGLAGCIMTKLDEAATIGNVLDVVIRQKLNLFYIANGQRVPEDLHLADPQLLIDRAFKPEARDAPFQYQDAELPLVMATPRMMNDRRCARCPLANFDFDQAEGLRRMLAKPAPRIVTFLSATPDHDKGAMLVNLGASLARTGNDVLLLDACASARRGPAPRRRMHGATCCRWRARKRAERRGAARCRRASASP
jgi:Mrp family chromosome partitioning ATPase